MAGIRTVADRIEFGDEYASDRERTRVGAAAVLVAGLGLVAAAGLSGVAAAAVLGIAWLLLAPTYAFAVGQVAVVAFAAGGGPFGAAAGLLGGASSVEVVGIVIAEVGLFGLLLAPATALANPRGPVALAVGWALGGGALAWISAESGLAPWLAGLVLLGATGLAAYVLHRYQIVALGLAEGVERIDAQGGDADER